MRGLIFEELHRRMQVDETLFFVTADMGINLVEVIEKDYPDRFLNVGIAEQNLIGVAAGLCNAGFRPVVYTIGNFLVHRCYEQIRDDVVLHDNPVILLGTSAGFDNAPLGPTHHLIDDWGPLRNLPGFDVYAPACAEFAHQVLDVAMSRDRPCYIRVAKGRPSIEAARGEVGYIEGEPGGVLLVTYGALASECLKVTERHPEISLLILNRINPVDADAISRYLSSHSEALVVEDHFGHTGLYGSLCQVAVERGIRTRISSAAPDHEYCLVVAQNPAGYLRRYRLDAEGIADRLAN